MIAKKKFVKLVVRKGSGITERSAEELYWSMARSIALFLFGKSISKPARAQEEKFQKTILAEIDFSKIDKDLRAQFRRIKIKEDNIRQKYGEDTFVTEGLILESHFAIFSEILEFSVGDAEKIEQIEKELDALRQNPPGQSNRKRNIVIGAAIVSALSVALYKIFSGNDKK